MLINCVYSSHNIVLCVASVCKLVHTVVENHCSSLHNHYASSFYDSNASFINTYVLPGYIAIIE